MLLLSDPAAGQFPATWLLPSLHTDRSVRLEIFLVEFSQTPARLRSAKYRMLNVNGHTTNDRIALTSSFDHFARLTGLRIGSICTRKGLNNVDQNITDDDICHHSTKIQKFHLPFPVICIHTYFCCTTQLQANVLPFNRFAPSLYKRPQGCDLIS